MGLGYQGYATINERQFLVTSLSIPEQEVRLDSSAGWGGQLSSTKTGIGAPHVYDFSTNDGSIGFELSIGFSTLLKSLISGRSSPFALDVHPCSGSQVYVGEAWWNSISLTGSEGSAVTGDISFLAVERGIEVIGSEYITNRVGDRGCEAFTDIPPLNPSAMNVSPVPFWKTSFSGTPLTNVEVISWTASFTQDIQKMFKCGASGKNPVAPFMLGFGPMSVELQLELFIKSGKTWSFSRLPGSIRIALGEGSSMTFSQLETQQHAQDIRGQSDISVVSVTYQVYSLAA